MSPDRISQECQTFLLSDTLLLLSGILDSRRFPQTFLTNVVPSRTRVLLPDVEELLSTGVRGKNDFVHKLKFETGVDR